MAPFLSELIKNLSSVINQDNVHSINKHCKKIVTNY